MTTPLASTETLSHFAQNAGEIAAWVKETGRPVILTVDGKEELAVMDVRSFRQFFEGKDEAEMRAFLDESIKQHEQGLAFPALEALDDLARRKGLRVPK
jgi:PHD/YefM family antitoxin component YafN of YafNO toxin-antitoxin module